MPRKKKSTNRKRSRATLHDVAAEAGVSIATVSYVLNNSGSISTDMRKKVRKAAAKLGYRQNRAARAMKTGHSDIIGLVIPNIENPFFATLAQAVLLECRRHDLQVFLVDTEGSHDTELKAMQGLVQQGVDGIIVFPIDDTAIGGGIGDDVPVVVLDRDSPDRDLVQAEYAEGGRLLANHLLELGHKRFGILEGPQVATSAKERSVGFAKAIGRKGKIVWREEHPFSMTLTDVAEKRLKQKDATAVVCGNDLIAMGVIQFFDKLGVDVPGDVSVVGFDDIEFSKVVSPPLTTIHLPTAQMGIEAVNLLTRRLQTEQSPDSRSRVVLDVDLKIRGSSGPANQ
jgi:LacI family transcriptional regulator